MEEALGERLSEPVGDVHGYIASVKTVDRFSAEKSRERCSEFYALRSGSVGSTAGQPAGEALHRPSSSRCLD